MENVSTFSILFLIRRDKPGYDGKCPIYARITVNGKRTHLASKRNVLPNKWNPKAGKARGNTEEARALNVYLDSIRSKLYEHHRTLIDKGKEVTASKLKEMYLGIDRQTKSLVELFHHHNDQLKAKVGTDFAPATLQRYETTLMHIIDFLSSAYGKDDIRLNEIDHKFTTDFEHYLKTVRKCGHNTTLKYISNLRKIINIALANDWLEKSPFRKFKASLKEVPRTFLTSEELKKIEDKDIAIERLDQVRDTFVFCCYTGLSYSDVAKLTLDNIRIGVDGEKWIFTNRAKTSVPSNVPLLAKAQKVLDKYEGHPVCEYKGTLLPMISNVKVNAYLKEIADICGIQKNLTFHVARHTFATTVTLNNDVPIETVSSMLGHKNLRTTQIYAKILEKKVGEDMMRLKERLSN